MNSFYLNEKILIDFYPLENGDFRPRLTQDNIIEDLPLLVAAHEVGAVIDKIRLINFYGLPYSYIAMIVAGCVVIVLKTSHKKNR